MSSNIKVQRVCQHCGKDFTARTTTTLYCSSKCNSASYKAKLRATKVEASNSETQRLKTMPLEVLNGKEFLTVRDVATLLNCSVRTVYYYIKSGNLKAVNLSQRITRVKRTDLDNLFEQTQPQPPPVPSQFNISDCYNLTEIQTKYRISEKALHDVIKRNGIPKIRKGWYAYVPKTAIDKILS